MPPVYKQLLLLKKIWEKSSDPNKEYMLTFLSEAIQELKEDYTNA